MHESQHLNKPQLARYLEVNWDYRDDKIRSYIAKLGRIS
jgi:hypothetical protein